MEIDNKKNIERFESLLDEVKRIGIGDVKAFIQKSDFYTAPASTRFHLAVEGGLLQHSLNVYDCLVAKLESPFWKRYLADIDRETIILVSLLHDICKTYFYVKDYRNQKTYDEDKVAEARKEGIRVSNDKKGSFFWETVEYYTCDNKYPLGHGCKSVFFLTQYIHLSMEEIAAINWHMGAYCGSDQWLDLGQAFEKYPLALALHEADAEATHLLETE